MKKILTIIMLLLTFFVVFNGAIAQECRPPMNWPYSESENYLNQEMETVFMGKVLSKKITRQGDGYKFFEIVLKTKVYDLKKGSYPEDGKIKIYVPVSTKICGYYDQNFFTIGSYMVIFAKKNNGLNLVDRYSMSIKFNDELVARKYINKLAENNKIKNNKITIQSISKFSMYYILVLGMLLLLFYYMFAKIYYNRKISKKDDDDNSLYYEDDGTMYFSTKGDEIEIRVKKDEISKK